MAISKVQICNRGLSRYLGVGRINSLDEATPAAEQCTLHYEDTLRAMLELHDWTFAQEQDVLAEVTNTLSDVWDYAYQKPAEAMRLSWVNKASDAHALMDQERDPDTRRRIIGDVIYSDVAEASAGYTTFLDDPTKYSQHFREALSAAIAASCAMALTENGRLAQSAAEAAESLIERAIVHDESLRETREAQLLPDWMRERGIS